MRIRSSSRPLAIVVGFFVALSGSIRLSAQPQDETPLSAEPPTRIVFVAGPPSHGYGAHEHYAGCMLLADCLEKGMPGFDVQVIKHSWPDDPSVFEDVDAVVMYSDGGPNHPAIKHLEQVNALAERGVGIVCIHYAVEMPPGEAGDALKNWIGGYFETNWSVNPHWKAEFTELPEHPTTRGVTPFASQDEWYFHMRFQPDMAGVTPILSAVAPESTMARPDGPHSGNPQARKAVADGEPQHVVWAFDRVDGGRGFGCTGGHFHWNWANLNFRRTVLNGIVWAAGRDVPETGVPVESVTLTTLQENQDFPVPDGFDTDKIAAEQADLKQESDK